MLHPHNQRVAAAGGFMMTDGRIPGNAGPVGKMCCFYIVLEYALADDAEGKFGWFFKQDR